MMDTLHIPVMPNEVLAALYPMAAEAPGRDKVFLDGTAGLGGHSELLAETGSKVICLDRDAEALERCKTRLERFGDRVTFIHDNFRDFLVNGSEQFDGILLDLGVSSMQLDRPERGFSYRYDAPLDMRMDTSQNLTAAEVVNEWEYRQLVRILYDYGEERYAPQLARGIVAARPLKTTAELTEAIIESMPARGRREAQHPARRTFQAIRIAVNEELTLLEEALPRAVERLKPGGRLALISFHSLEDRVTKRVFNEAAKGCTCPPSFPACICGKRSLLKIIGRIKPTIQETEENPRSASAVLRVAERIERLS